MEQKKMMDKLGPQIITTYWGHYETWIELIFNYVFVFVFIILYVFYVILWIQIM